MYLNLPNKRYLFIIINKINDKHWLMVRCISFAVEIKSPPSTARLFYGNGEKNQSSLSSKLRKCSSHCSSQEISKL